MVMDISNCNPQCGYIIDGHEFEEVKQRKVKTMEITALKEK